MTAGAWIALGILLLGAAVCSWLLWRWAGRQVAARRTAQAAAAESRLATRAWAALEAEQAKSDREAAETMRRRLARARPRP